MFIKKDSRKVHEILADPESSCLKFARRSSEFKNASISRYFKKSTRSIQHVKSLSLYDNLLKNLEGIGVFENSSLTELNLGRNKLEYLPDEIKAIQSLTKLWMDDNLLENFPLCLLELQNLQVLRVTSNKISSIPPQIRMMGSLIELAIDNNLLTELPDTLTECTQLEKLILRQNQITHLPKDFGNLRRLKYLCLNSNCLESIPESFAQLEQLETLYLNTNKLRDAPSSLLHVGENLTYINLANNLIDTLSEEWVERWGELDRPSGKCINEDGGRTALLLGNVGLWKEREKDAVPVSPSPQSHMMDTS